MEGSAEGEVVKTVVCYGYCMASRWIVCGYVGSIFQQLLMHLATMFPTQQCPMQLFFCLLAARTFRLSSF